MTEALNGGGHTAIGKRLLAGLLLLLVFEAHAATGCLSESDKPILCSYEPNSFGWTKEGYTDKGFLDVNLSLRYRLFPVAIRDKFGKNFEMYVAATARFGQYLGSESAPVIGKRFNPKLIFRTETGAGPRIDFAYAHESNGQSINTPGEFDSASMSPKQAEFARDQISRGWDYLEIEGRTTEVDSTNGGSKRSMVWYGKFRYFLSNGIFQGRPEEYNAWEMDPEGKSRNQVNGVAGMLKYVKGGPLGPFENVKFFAGYETGYRRILKYNTFRFEVAGEYQQLPLYFWVQNGYGNNLALYYKRMSSYGIGVQIGTF